MRWLLERAGKLVLAIWALFLVPIIVEVLKSWIKKWSGYENPSSVLNVVGELVYVWWAQWVFIFVSGLLLGLWSDRVARSVLRRDNSKIISLGHAMGRMADRIGQNTYHSVEPWPANIGVPRGELLSLAINIQKAGLWYPDNKVFEAEKGRAFLINYLATIGTLLADGHVNEAKETSLAGKRQFEIGM